MGHQRTVIDTESYRGLQQSYGAYSFDTELETRTIRVLSRPYNQGTYGRIRSKKIPYSPVLQELRRKGNAECLYRRNLNGISDSDSNSDSDMISLPQQISVLRDRCLKRINTSAAGVAYSGPAYDSPSSKDVTEVEYATEWYSESPGRPSLSPATKKRHRDQMEAEMSEMSSMSESEILAVMEEQARKKQKDQRKYLEYRSNTQGDME
jgi:hypothetical protein